MVQRSIRSVGLTVVLLWAMGYGAAQNEHGGGDRPPLEQGPKTRETTTRPARPLCPVMGRPVDFSVRTVTDDGPVYFCCPGCIARFEKDRAQYGDKVAAQRQALSTLRHVQVSCPVTGNPIDGKTFVFSGGEGVNFCCEKCPPKYEQDPARYKAKLRASYTYQTRCPVSGETIDPTAYVDVPTGQRIYLCCKGCAEKLLKDPAAYAANLEQQGIKLDVQKLTAHPEPKGNPRSQSHGCCGRAGS
jgi:YHS domain-containing protein